MPCGSVFDFIHYRREVHSEESPKSQLKRPPESYPVLRIPRRPGAVPVLTKVDEGFFCRSDRGEGLIFLRG